MSYNNVIRKKLQNIFFLGERLFWLTLYTLCQSSRIVKYSISFPSLQGSNI